MKIGILSREPDLYSTRRLAEAARAAGHEVEIVDYLRCYMNIAAVDQRVVISGRSLDAFDAIIPRIGASQTFYGTAVVRQFEVKNVYSLNGSLAIARSRDKLRSLQILSRRGIGLPVTGFAHSTKDIEGLLEIVGGPPVVIKLLEGTQGLGVVLCETRKAAESVIEAFRGLNVNILVQEFIAEAGGADIRALVVGERVVAAVMRKAREGEFRAGGSRSGSAEKIKLTKDERAAATQAAKAMGLRVAGVDLLRSERGPLVIEVSSSPGLELLESVAGVDVAGAMVRHVERRAPGGEATRRGGSGT